MAVSFLSLEQFSHSFNSIGKIPRPFSRYKLHLRHHLVLASTETLFSRRRIILCNGVSLISILNVNYGLTPLAAGVEEKDKKEEDEGDNGVFGAVKSLFDPNEKTKSGKALPKAYLKSAREVVKTLRESLKEDSKDIAKFRRTADAAKESIREYLNGGWKGQGVVAAEKTTSLSLSLSLHYARPCLSSLESFIALEKAIRSLASFYSKAGPFAVLPEDVKSSILDDLNTAEDHL